jgi:DNA-binding transcriptional LysR family regulator
MTALVDRAIGRLKLRDLRLLEAVVRWKNIAKAAAQLNLTPPAVSKALSELEHTLGVRLLDRNRQGIEPTAHGHVLLRHAAAIFDEIRQGVSEIEHLSDPAAGEVRIAASIPMAAGILPVIVARFSKRYPRITVQAREILVGSLQFETPQYRDLRERSVDLVLGPIVRGAADKDLNGELMFEDPLIVATGKQHPLTRRRHIELGDLVNESWCLPPPNSVAGLRCVEAFRLKGLDLPRHTVTAMSVHLQIGLLASHRFFTMFPGSLMQFGAQQFSIRGLPIDLGVRSLPIGILTWQGERSVPPRSFSSKRRAKSPRPSTMRHRSGCAAAKRTLARPHNAAISLL